MNQNLSLEKLLQKLGFGSRKECRKLVHRGAVELQGSVCTDPDFKVPLPHYELRVHGAEVATDLELFLVLYKPAGYECSHDPQHHHSVFSLFPPRMMAMGLKSAGRLDVDTTGLLILSTQGDFIHHIESPRRGLPKTYQVEFATPVSPAQISQLQDGILLKGEKSPLVPGAVKLLGTHQIELQIGEGRYHQVKRMCKAVGLEVVKLHRSKLGELDLQDLSVGEWRALKNADFHKLAWNSQ